MSDTDHFFAGSSRHGGAISIPFKRLHPGIRHLVTRASVVLTLTGKVDKARAVFAAAPGAHTMTIPHRPENNPTVAMVMPAT